MTNRCHPPKVKNTTFLDGGAKLGKFWNKSGNILCWGGLGFETTGSGHFNKTGADYDFQVQSNGETHKFFVDAGADCVGINQSSPDSTVGLDINDDALFTDDKKLYFGTGKDAHIEYDEDGSDMLIISGPAGGISITGSVTTHLTGASNPTGLGTGHQFLIRLDQAGARD